MKIFLDFDDTLFNTRAFIGDMKGVFVECGISRELFQSSYDEVKASFGQGERTYDFDEHIKNLQGKIDFDVAVLRNKVQVFVADTTRYLFPDVMDFFSAMKEKGCALYILSFGTSDFQAAKIAGTGMKLFMEKIIITTGDKAVALQNEVIDDGKNSWFFDDRMKYIESMKQVFPAMQTVFVKRVDGRYEDSPNEFCDYVVQDLKEAEKILKNI